MRPLLESFQWYNTHSSSAQFCFSTQGAFNRSGYTHVIKDKIHVFVTTEEIYWNISIERDYTSRFLTN